MSDGPRQVPDFDELVDPDELGEDEAARLRRVHELLVQAGPPPELSSDLRSAGLREPASSPLFRRRRLGAAIALAAGLAAAAFGAGYVVGNDQATAEPVRVLAMSAPAGAARASLAVFPVDESGNWPMELTVSRLAPLGAGETYELWLTRAGKLAESCGTFLVEPDGSAVVSLNAPYKLRSFDGWVVVRRGTAEPVLTT